MGGSNGTEPVRALLERTRRIAVVGLSPKPHRPSHNVAAALKALGYDIVPVNPYADDVLGVPAYPTLREVPGPIDLVDVFRRAEALPDVAREAVEVGARGLWAQLGLRSLQARRICAAAGIPYVEDRCLKVEVARHARDMLLPPPAV